MIDLVAGAGRCEEASALSGSSYIPCNAPATKIVGWPRRPGEKNLRMCEACAAHNTHNRGAVVVGPFPADEVTRYVPTYVNKDGMRTLMTAAQGRYTFATAAEAQEWLDAVSKNNSADTVRSLWGDNPRFEVRPCPCWPGHFDPKGVWFDEFEDSR